MNASRTSFLVVAAAAAAAAAMAAVTACGSGKAGSGSEPVVVGGEQQLVSVGRDYAQCVRDNGVPNYPDMVVIGGRLTLPDDSSGDAGEEALRANPTAQLACRSILDRLPANAQKQGAVTAEDRESLLRYAQCLRDNGIPEWPDPASDGSFPLAGTALADEGKSARMLSATQACKQHWDQGVAVK